MLSLEHFVGPFCLFGASALAGRAGVVNRASGGNQSSTPRTPNKKWQPCGLIWADHTEFTARLLHINSER